MTANDNLFTNGVVDVIVVEFSSVNDDLAAKIKKDGEFFLTVIRAVFAMTYPPSLSVRCHSWSDYAKGKHSYQWSLPCHVHC